jgi:hypothetical protein
VRLAAPATLLLVATTVLCAATLLAKQKTTAGQESPHWVAEQIELRDTGRDSRLDMTMRLYDRQGRVRERSLVMTGLRRPASTTAIGDRVLIRFVTPNDIKGTGFLVWEHANADDERFLYLPALGRVRRIAGAEKQESFVGSDLSYEDIGGRELSDYTYRFVQRDASWVAPDGRSHPAWQLESRTVDTQAAYPRTVSLVRKDNFVVVAAEIFNRRDEREKKFDVRRLEQVDGVWTATDVVMANEAQRTRTELVVTQARYNIGLSEADFTRRVLEQGAR